MTDWPCSFDIPSPIQASAIPLGKFGVDIIAQAKSGTGKTVVFAVIILENIVLSQSGIQAMVIVPTRELAVQIQGVLQGLGQHLNGFVAHYFVGGLSLKEDIKKAERCHVAVGTPGRLKQMVEEGLMDVSSVRILVLDEVDRMLSGSFLPEIEAIKNKLPSRKQVMMFSATFDDKLKKTASQWVRSPQFIDMCPESTLLRGVKQYSLEVSTPTDGKHSLMEAKERFFFPLLDDIPFSQCLVFVPQASWGARLVERLQEEGLPSVLLAANMDQHARIEALHLMQTFSVRILVCTDVAARGLDLPAVNVVFHLAIPTDAPTYIHRLGRTGRYGTMGLSIAILTPAEKEVLSQWLREEAATSQLATWKVGVTHLEEKDHVYIPEDKATRAKLAAFQRVQKDAKSLRQEQERSQAQHHRQALLEQQRRLQQHYYHLQQRQQMEQMEQRQQRQQRQQMEMEQIHMQRMEQLQLMQGSRQPQGRGHPLAHAPAMRSANSQLMSHARYATLPQSPYQTHHLQIMQQPHHPGHRGSSLQQHQLNRHKQVHTMPWMAQTHHH
mgnify:CR=1 FL=1